MQPADLNLPAKFASWRRIGSSRTQYDAILRAACSDKRFVILNAPPGVGKSTIYMGLASLLGARTAVLTQTKGLQDQLDSDFSPMGLVQIKGQNNYPCLWFAEERRHLPGCDEGPCHVGLECVHREGGCHYYDAVRRAARSSLVVTNYSYWMSVRRYADPVTLGPFDALVLDEAHDAAQALADFVKIELHSREVEKQLDLRLPFGASITEWTEWAREAALPVCLSRLDAARTQVSLLRRGISTVRALQSIEASLRALAAASSWHRVDAPDPPAWVPGTSTDWIVEETRDGATFQPVWASGYAEMYLFGRIPRVILVSATVTPKDAAFLGIPPSEFEYQEYPSPFKREIRPIFIVPTARVGRNISVGEERVWLNRIDQIIETEAVEANTKGLIHAVSYERAKLIYARSKFQSIMEIHDRHSLRNTVARFRAAPPPRILVSPSIGTGWDFPYDLARWQIIAKIPFIDNRPAIVKARHKADKGYIDYVTLVALIQMVGRIVRSDNDYGRTWIIDDNWKDWFYPRNKKLVPKWFKGAIRRVSSVWEVEPMNRRLLLTGRNR